MAMLNNQRVTSKKYAILSTRMDIYHDGLENLLIASGHEKTLRY